ncbi:MAG: filamentous hemagglutinin N-terminal domain-containing protein [Nostocales cyanobacterium 94392]|nr:filamentous hemagglutinin N-terminal domain-containing protein [Nostocales cyanobacterium 94392]
MGYRHYILSVLSFTLSLLPVLQVKAQLIPDNTLDKENSIVNSVNSMQKIDGGAIRGSNLFHRFKEFNIDNGESVYFSNPGTIKNILTRVTGTNPSQIFGKLGVLGDANLFLINPNGIIFGENAKLDIGGSFVGSTADNIKFADSTEFNAVNPSANPILTISVPLGLQYGSNPGNIEVRGTAALKLQVPDNKFLALIGGNIKLDGGKLAAPAGGIGLLAVKNGEVSLVNRDGQIKLEVGKGIGYGNIELLNAANVDASGNSGGSIQIQGKNIILKDSSIISTNTEGNGSGEKLNIVATELLKISGSGLFANVQQRATGTGGDLTIGTTNLQVDDGGQISAATYGSGNGGDLTIETTNLQLYGGGQISAGTVGKGTAGNMEIKADLVELVGFRQSGDTPAKSGLFVSALQEDGQGGNLTLTANQLIIRDGATINASNFFSSDPENLRGLAGTGAAGNININSPFIQLKNQAIITANANAGDKGNINIQSQNLQLRQGSVISTNAKNSANGGNINIDTNTLLALENSDITANSEGSFGGRVIINAQGILGTQFQQKLTPQSDITATSSLGASFNGVVDINTIAYDPNSGLVELPQALSDSNQKIKAGCAGSIGNNFIVSGKGGLPQSPDDLFSGNTTNTELFDLVPSNSKTPSNISDRKSNVSMENQKNQIVEATGWEVDADGNVIFGVQMPESTQKYSRINSVTCKNFSTVDK